MREEVEVRSVLFGGGAPLAAICGPCQIESRDHTLRMAEAVKRASEEAGVPVVFKASFDKANRSRVDAPRGAGFVDGLPILAEVRETFGMPVVTDVHETWQVRTVAKYVDMLQIPAMLCRQTDLLVEAGQTGLPVMVKKGQFMAPEAMEGALEKVWTGGVVGAMLCERGTSFGYGRLVVDMTGLAVMRGLRVPVIFDATHSVQRPGMGPGGLTGGARGEVILLARAAVAAGVDGVFLEVHDDPARAPSDGATMLKVSGLANVLRDLKRIDETVWGVRP